MRLFIILISALLIAETVPPQTTAPKTGRAMEPVVGKLNTYEKYSLWELMDGTQEAERRLAASKSDLRLFLNTPPEKRASYYAEVVASQQKLVEKYASELAVAEEKEAKFRALLNNPEARKVMNKAAKEAAKLRARAVRAEYRGNRLSVTVECRSYRGVRYSRTTCTAY